MKDRYHLITEVRALQSDAAKTPALVLTAFAGEKDIQHAHRAGFDLHLAKPVVARKLALAIAQLGRLTH